MAGRHPRRATCTSTARPSARSCCGSRSAAWASRRSARASRRAAPTTSPSSWTSPTRRRRGRTSPRRTAAEDSRPIRCLAQLCDQLRSHGARPVAAARRRSWIACWPPPAVTRRAIREEFGQTARSFPASSARTTSAATCRSRELRIRIQPAGHGLRDFRPRLCGPHGRLPHHGFHSARLSIAGLGVAGGAVRAPWAGAIEFVEESDEDLAAVVAAAGPTACVMPLPDRVPAVVRQAAGGVGRVLGRPAGIGRGPRRVALVRPRAEHQFRLSSLRQSRRPQRRRAGRSAVSGRPTTTPLSPLWERGWG